jgi:hypothetical protein
VTAYQFMREHRNEHAVRKTAGIFGVSGSAYYKRAKKAVSGGRKEAGAELADMIRRTRERHHYRYGSPRVREELRRDYGKRVSRKKVAALMRKNGLNAGEGGSSFQRPTQTAGFRSAATCWTVSFTPKCPGRNGCLILPACGPGEAGRV